MLVPLLVCGGVELALRVFGYGYRTSFFAKVNIRGENYYVPNDEFGYRFFPRSLARTPADQRMAVNKSADTFRIFVFGESAALGDPDPSFGAWRYLQVLLGERYPGTDFEVVCTAMTAINSHVILPIARECAGRDGDLWIIYMGNNEMVGPFGGGTVFGSRAPRAGLVRAALAVKTLKLGQLLNRLLQRWGAISPAPTTWGGLTMFEQQQVRDDDPNRLRAYENFKENLDDILRAGNRAGVPIILSTVGSNLKDCSPFASLHSKGLSETQKAEWDGLYRNGLERQAARDYSGALRQFKEAAAIDSHYAELQFCMGCCDFALTNAESARREFELARDYDALSFRADSRINQIIRDDAAACAGLKVHLLDAAQQLAQDSSEAIPGNKFFYEHVHLNFEGNYLLARALAEQTARLLPKAIASRGKGNWASQEVCERRLAVSSWDRYRMWQEILSRVSVPPFTEQSAHNALLELCNERLGELKARLEAQTTEQTRQLYKAALAAAPSDSFLHWNFAQFLGAKGDLAGATEEAQRVCELLPQSLGQYYDIGNLLILQGKIDEAADYFSRALAIQGDFVNALNGMGIIRQNEQKAAEALAYFKHALREDSDHADTCINLGFLEQERGDLQKAGAYYQRAAQLQPRGPADYLDKAVAYSALGQRSHAIESFQTAVQMKPDFWQAHYLLGLELATQGEIEAARAEFFDAGRYRPDFAKAHLNLGLMLDKQGKPEQALNEFRITLQIEPTNQPAQQVIERLNERKSRK